MHTPIVYSSPPLSEGDADFRTFLQAVLPERVESAETRDLANDNAAATRHPQWRTKPCFHWLNSGRCRDGDECRFIHDEKYRGMGGKQRAGPPRDDDDALERYKRRVRDLEDDLEHERRKRKAAEKELELQRAKRVAAEARAEVERLKCRGH